MSIFPHIEIEGTSYEIGYQEGENFREQIQEALRVIKNVYGLFKPGVGRAKELSRKFIEVIRDYNADYLEEIRGVADGSGFEFEDILALNCRSELVFVGKEFDKQDGGSYVHRHYPRKSSERRGALCP